MLIEGGYDANAMLKRHTTTVRGVSAAVLALLCSAAFYACGEPQPADGVTPESTGATSTPTAPLDERLKDAAATQTAQSGAERFNGEILGLYVAPSIDDWPQAVRDQHERTIAGGCVNAPTGQSELDFMRPLDLPPGFEPAGNLESTGRPEVVACGGRTAGLNFEYQKLNDDGTPAMVTLARTVARAETFDALASDVTARTIGARQAVVIAPAVEGAPGQRSMVLFPEDFGATIVHAFNLTEEDLLDFAEAVAEASAPSWEELGTVHGDDEIRVCAELPPVGISHQAAFARTADERTSRVLVSYFSGERSAIRSNTLVLHPGDSLDDCPGWIIEFLAYGADPALYDAARAWVVTQGGELAGECATRPSIIGAEPALTDWCFYRPRRELDGTIVISVGRVPDYYIELVTRPGERGGYELLDVVAPVHERLRFWHFPDEHEFRWSRHEGASAYRLKATLMAIREHAPDPCAAPPLAEQMIEITLDETFAADVHAYFVELPALPPDDAWYVAINGTGAEAMVIVEALDADGNVLDQTGTSWIRDLFCVRPRADAE